MENSVPVWFSLGVPGQPGLHNETQVQQTKDWVCIPAIRDLPCQVPSSTPPGVRESSRVSWRNPCLHPVTFAGALDHRVPSLLHWSIIDKSYLCLVPTAWYFWRTFWNDWHFFSDWLDLQFMFAEIMSTLVGYTENVKTRDGFWVTNFTLPRTGCVTSWLDVEHLWGLKWHSCIDCLVPYLAP